MFLREREPVNFRKQLLREDLCALVRTLHPCTLEELSWAENIAHESWKEKLCGKNWRGGNVGCFGKNTGHTCINFSKEDIKEKNKIKSNQ